MYGKTSFESHENSYWFLKNSSRSLSFTIFFTESWYNTITHPLKKFKVSLTASFRGSKVRQKIIREKLKIYKNSQNAIKLKKSPKYLQKVLSHENRFKNALFTANNMILRFFFAQEQNFSIIHKTDIQIFLAKKMCVLWYWIINQIAKFQGFWWTLVQFFRIAQSITLFQ
jgi:hypothetical protein